MNVYVDAPILGWRTLKDIHDYYLAQTPSEEGPSAAEVVDRAAKQTLLHGVAVQVEAASGRMTPERRDQVAGITKANDQAARMRAIVGHIMTRDAAAGAWFAIGRVDGVGKHQLIHPRHWNFLLMNIERGAVGRDSLRFEDLRCAFTKDVPREHPVYQALCVAQNEMATPPPNGPIVQQPIDSPPPAPQASQEIVRTGAPGRPSSMYIVEQEFVRRCRDSEVIWSSVRAEADHLAAWFESRRNNAPKLTARTIENRIRHLYNKARPTSGKPTKL